jgi:pimeloyl-ACP methyl ester carboxylesterase
MFRPRLHTLLWLVVCSTILSAFSAHTTSSTQAAVNDVLLSEGKPVTTYDYDCYECAPPSNANDGDFDTRWDPNGPLPYWWQVDLESANALTQVMITWGNYSDQWVYIYEISVSEDGENFTEVTTNIIVADPASDDDAYATAVSIDKFTAFGRYVRIAIIDFQGPYYNHEISEIQVFGYAVKPRPELDITVQAPASLTLNNGEYEPNPFDIVASVENTTSYPIEYVQLTLQLPPSLPRDAGLETLEVGTLAPGQREQVVWSVRAAQVSSETELTYSVTAEGLDIDPLTVQGHIALPAAKLPVIFVPGISGSYLYDGKDQLWVGTRFTNHKRLSLYPQDNPSSSIVAPDVIRHHEVVSVPIADIYGSFIDRFIDGGYREYLFTLQGCDTTQKPDQPNFFVFPYDWRLDNATNADRLAHYIECVQQFYPGTKVNIVAHSMGGLLARRYILDHPDNHYVNALITIGSPFLGAPKAIYALETGDFLDAAQHIAVVSQPTLKSIVGSFPGAAQLLPSSSYYQMGEIEPLIEEGWDWNGNGNDYDRYDYLETIKVINKRYGHQPSFYPGTWNRTFHTKDQDDWTNDQSGVKYFHIYGIETRIPTIGQVITKREILCNPISDNIGSICDPETQGFLTVEHQYVSGDGTVPVVSASRQIRQQDIFNHPSATVVRANGNIQGHVGMPGSVAVQDQVFEFLANSADISIQSFAARGSITATNDTNDDPPFVPLHFVKIHGLTSWKVTDNEGNAMLMSNGLVEGAVPGVTTYSMSQSAEEFILDPSGGYTVSFQTADIPLLIEIVTSDGATATQSIRYRDLVLPADVSAQLMFSPQAIEHLRYDSNGDGTFDGVANPTVQLSGSAANDQGAPTVTVSQQVQGSTTRITLTTHDDGAGVQTLLYSLDGTTFQPYTNSLTVDPKRTKTIFAFADDKAGNRSDRIEATVKGSDVAPIRPILECVANNGDGTYTAYFGYKNENATAVSIPIGVDNKFTPGPLLRGQPQTFQPGRTPYYPQAHFSVVFDGSNLVWTLWGRTATASQSSKTCQ